MSRNSKNAQRTMLKKQLKRAKYDGKQSVSTGQKGPSRTEPKHTKKNAWFQSYDSHGDYVAAQKKSGRKSKEDREG